MSERFKEVWVEDSFIQHTNILFVCVRKRGPWGTDPVMEARLGPFSWKEAQEQLEAAVKKWGPRYKVVLEPVESKGGS